MISLEVKSVGALISAEYKDCDSAMTFKKIGFISKFEFKGNVKSRRTMRVLIKQIVSAIE